MQKTRVFNLRRRPRDIQKHVSHLSKSITYFEPHAYFGMSIQIKREILLHKLSREAAAYRSALVNDINGHHNIVALAIDKKWRVLCKGC